MPTIQRDPDSADFLLCAAIPCLMHGQPIPEAERDTLHERRAELGPLHSLPGQLSVWPSNAQGQLQTRPMRAKSAAAGCAIRRAAVCSSATLGSRSRGPTCDPLAIHRYAALAHLGTVDHVGLHAINPHQRIRALLEIQHVRPIPVRREDLKRIEEAVEPYGLRYRHAAGLDMLVPATEPTVSP